MERLQAQEQAAGHPHWAWAHATLSAVIGWLPASSGNGVMLLATSHALQTPLRDGSQRYAAQAALQTPF